MKVILIESLDDVLTNYEVWALDDFSRIIYEFSNFTAKNEPRCRATTVFRVYLAIYIVECYDQGKWKYRL